MSTADDHPHASGRIIDAGALKALAHPLRYRLLELLLEDGPATASSLGRVVGENSGSTSYHLRQLAEHGLIEEAEDVGNLRDRWWRAVEGGWTLQGFEMLQQDDTREDARQLLDHVQRSRLDRLQRWHADGPRWGNAWVKASIEATSVMHLTHQQLAELTDELMATAQRFKARQADADPQDVAAVAVHIEAFPTENPPPEPVDG